MKHFLNFPGSFLSVIVAGCLFVGAVFSTPLIAQTNAQDTPTARKGGVVTSFAPVIKRVAPSVVNIYSTMKIRERQTDAPMFTDPFWRQFFGEQGDRRQRSRPLRSQSLGSGVIVSRDGYILTANHVVEGAEEVKVALPGGEREFTAKIIGIDPPTDVAVLKIDGTNLPAATTADSDKLEVGDVVLAIGNPFEVGQTVTMGIISGVGRTSLGIADYENFIQTDAAINPGNSGGALTDAEGRVVGINTAIFSRSGGNQGLGFAVPINLARSVMDRLIKDGKVTRGYLGVSLQDITPALAEEFNLPNQTGALVGGVQPNTAAAEAGMTPGDIITEFNGRKVTDSSQLRLVVAQNPPKTKANLKLIRDGRERTLSVTLGERPENLARMERQDEGGQPESGDLLDGVEVSDLDAGARQQFKIPNSIRGGVVVLNTEPDSEAFEKGLRPGDVIVEANHQPVRVVDDLSNLSEKTQNKRMLLRVWHGGGTRFIMIEPHSQKPDAEKSNPEEK